MMKRTTLIILFFAFAIGPVSAQCFLDRHNTTWYDGWLSCTPSMNPNAVRGESHWILYDLNYAYGLFQLHLWNTNAPEYLNSGMQDIAIDISNDGVNWTEAGEFQLPMADGTPTYEGVSLHDFEGTNARYVLITGLTNHGGSCYGLSEIRINVADEIITPNTSSPVPEACLSARVFPNPVREHSRAMIQANCSTAPVFYSIADLSGKTIASGQLPVIAGEGTLELNTLPVAAGMYVLSVRQQDLVRRFKVIKAE